MRESFIEKRVCHRAKLNGWIVHPKAAAGARGWPDRTFTRVKDNRFQLIFVEFKAPGKRPTRLQTHTIEKLRTAGYEVHVIDSIKTGTALFA